MYLAMDAWLATFAHRVSIGPSIFLASATVALVAAFVTVALQSYCTARGRPLEAVRYEYYEWARAGPNHRHADFQFAGFTTLRNPR